MYEDDDYQDSSYDTEPDVSTAPEEETWTPYEPPPTPPPPPSPPPLQQYAAADTRVSDAAAPPAEPEVFKPWNPSATTAADDGEEEKFTPYDPADTTTEVLKAAQRGPLEGLDTALAISRGPIGMAEKFAYQPAAAIANYLKPDLNLPSHLLPNVSSAIDQVAPGYIQSIAPHPNAPAVPRYAGAITEAVTNPASWVGPGGPLVKGALAVGAGVLGQFGQDIGGTPGGIIAGMALPFGIGARGYLGSRRAAARPPPIPPPVQDAAPRAPTADAPPPDQGVFPGIGGGEQQPGLPLDQPKPPPPRPGVSTQPELGLEPPPAVDEHGQLGFNITAPDRQSTNAQRDALTQQAASRPSMPSTGGVATEAVPPPSARGEPDPYPHSAVKQGFAADVAGVTPDAARGVNVMQPGQVDPAVNLAMRGGQPEPPAPRPRTNFEGPPPGPQQGPPPPETGAPIPPERSLVPRVPETRQGMTEPPVPDNHTRMYQGERHPENTFTTDRQVAEQHGPVRAVDVHNERGMPFFQPTNAPDTFTTRNPNYRRNAQPVEALRTEPAGAPAREQAAPPETPPRAAAEAQAPEPRTTAERVESLDREKAATPKGPLRSALEEATAAGLHDAETLIEHVNWALENGRPDIAEAIVSRLEARVKDRAQQRPGPNAQMNEKLAQNARQEAAITANLRAKINAAKAAPVAPAAARPEMPPKAAAAIATSKAAPARARRAPAARAPLEPTEIIPPSRPVGPARAAPEGPTLNMRRTGLPELKTGEGRPVAEALLKHVANTLSKSLTREEQGRFTAAIKVSPHLPSEVLENIARTAKTPKEAAAMAESRSGGVTPKQRQAYRDLRMADPGMSHEDALRQATAPAVPPKAATAIATSKTAPAPEDEAIPAFLKRGPGNELPARRGVIEQTTEKHGGLEPATEALIERINQRIDDIGSGKVTPGPGEVQRLAITRRDMEAKRGARTAGAAAAKAPERGRVIARSNSGTEAGFTGETVHAAAAFAKAAGYKPHQIFNEDGTRYTPPKAAPAAAAAAAPAERPKAAPAAAPKATAAAAEAPKTTAPAAPPAPPAKSSLADAIISRLPASLQEAARTGADNMANIVREAQMLVAPMATGTKTSMRIAKNFADSMRLNRWNWSLADSALEKEFTPEQRKAMWDAADEASVMAQKGEKDPSKGLARLPADQRAVVEALQTRGRAAWEAARDLGMVQGEGLPFYTPRMLYKLAHMASGEGPHGLDPIGANLRTTTAQLLRRKYLTAEETEAAAKAKLGPEAEIARDIRSLPLATAKLEDAIVGRRMVDSIRDVGKQVGEEMISEGGRPVGSPHKWITVDHPALTTWRSSKDANGNTSFQRVPLYIRGDFEGPLRSVLNTKDSLPYTALMALKGKTMGLVMNSPLIHNAVEWGRALPAMPGKVATFRIYFEGNRAKNNPAIMREAISSGLVPIGKRFFNQDINAIMEQPNLTPGRSWTAKVLGAVPGLFDPAKGVAVRRAIDRAGDFWHNTLLWDRIGDLQMGLYTNMRDNLVAKGENPQVAARIAAHWANRYSGALPKEAMSDAARKISNMLLFSRSFTMGNLGAMKDMVNGLPRDVRAQISHDIGNINPESEGYIKSLARRKAIAVVALDVGLYYISNSLLQSASNVIRGDKSVDEEARGYADRLHDAATRVREDPSELLQPLSLIESLSSTSENEPGLEGRIMVGHTKDGTAIYARNPAGKIGEEFLGYGTTPLDMIKRKESTTFRPAWEILSNDKGFGRKVYDPNAHTPMEYLKNIGLIAAHFAGAQTPLGQIGALKDLVMGEGDKKLNTLQAAGPVAGVTFRRGAPGGESMGELYHAREKHQYKVNEALPDIRLMIQRGDVDKAVEKMTELGIPRGLQKYYMRTTEEPAARQTKRAVKDFYGFASPEEVQRFERAKQRQRQEEAQ